MIVTFILIAAGASAAAVARPAARRLSKERRLLLMAAKTEREAREREKQADEEAFMEAQRRYFAQAGIRTLENRPTPRQADLGTLQLERVEEGENLPAWKAGCRQGCGKKLVTMREIAPGREDSCVQGVVWDDIGRYCARCGAWETNDAYLQHFKPRGPLGKRLRGATNLFDVLGDPKRETPEDEWRRLETEEADLEASLGRVRNRRLALAQRLGKPMLGGPMRLELPAKTGT